MGSGPRFALTTLLASAPTTDVQADLPTDRTSIRLPTPGAPLLLLTTLLGLRPERTDVQADLPDTIGHVAIRRQPDHSPLPPAPTTV